MGIVKTSDEFVHPEGKIQLLNGNVLECYPLEQSSESVDNEMKLDNTGTYFVVGKSKFVAKPTGDEHKEAELSLFLRNAFLFLCHRDRIMSDSRMFLCPVPVRSGLAYTGTSGFNYPTLGVYLEWWLSCESSMINKKDKTRWLVYHIAGSPLSGMNHCGIVGEDGNRKTESIYPFLPLWSSFARINARYDEAKSLYQALTLEEVVGILEQDGLTSVDDKDLQILFFESEMRRSQNELSGKIKYLEKNIERLKSQLMYEHKAELEAVLAEFNEKKETMERREKEITEACRDLRKKLKLNLISNKQYQTRLSPLKKEKCDSADSVREWVRRAIDKLFCGLVTIFEVERFMENPEAAKPKRSIWDNFPNTTENNDSIG